MLRIAMTSATLLLGACTLGPNFVRPDDAPFSCFSNGRGKAVSKPVAEPVDVAWWSAFGDKALTRLAERVAAENLDVQTAVIRISESRAQRGIMAADQFPQVNGNASYTREESCAKGVASLIGGGSATQANGLGGRQSGTPAGGLGGALVQPFDLFQAGFDA